MGRFATGKFAKGISDRSGMEYRLRDMKLEWNGSLVGPDEFERKHPQLGPFNVPVDGQAVRNARPARTENAIERLLKPNAFVSGSSGSAVITVTEASHGRSTSDTVRFRDAISVGGIAATTINSASGFTITNIDTNNYSFPSGVTATITQKGGGGLASAGPTSITN